MDLTDEQWLLIQPLFPPLRAPGGRGRPQLDQRTLINGILWKLRYNKPWRSVPARYGSHEASYQRYNILRRSGLMARILGTLYKDLETRGGFNYKEYIANGIVHVEEKGDHLILYIHSEYAEDWRVSTGLIFYHKILQAIKEKKS